MEKTENTENREKAGQTDRKPKTKMNLPNKLTLMRICLVPVFMALMLLPLGDWFPSAPWWLFRTVAAVVFIVSALTDMLDGKIARKYHLITDFGKFLDPLADKMLVIGALLACSVVLRDEIGVVLSWVTFLVVIREFAVTSMRLVVVNTSGIVVAASILGKIKTVSQIIGICFILLEPVVLTPLLRLVIPAFPEYLFSYILMVVLSVTTLLSGIDYLRSYWKYIDSNK